MYIYIILYRFLHSLCVMGSKGVFIMFEIDELRLIYELVLKEYQLTKETVSRFKSDPLLVSCYEKKYKKLSDILDHLKDKI